MGGHRARAAVPALLIALALAAGCSSQPASGPNTPAPTVTPASPASPNGTGSPTGNVCTAFADLKTAVGGLATISAGNGALAQIEQNVADIRAKLNTFVVTAQGQFGPQTTQLRTTLSNLEIAIRAAAASPNATTISSVATSVGDVVASYNSLQAAVQTRCG